MPLQTTTHTNTHSSSSSLQVTDGAAAVLMMTRREALARGLPIMAIFRSFAAVSLCVHVYSVCAC
jgi:acetyl-CoA acyltransferase 1